MYVSKRLRNVEGGDFGASLKTSGQRQPIRVSISDVERPNSEALLLWPLLNRRRRLISWLDNDPHVGYSTNDPSIWSFASRHEFSENGRKNWTLALHILHNLTNSIFFQIFQHFCIFASSQVPLFWNSPEKHGGGITLVIIFRMKTIPDQKSH